MNKLTHKELATHPVILSSIGIVVVIAIGSILYYSNSSMKPAINNISTVKSADVLSITGSGTVEPAENPDLAFASGGRVASVIVSVGQKVYQGQTLASLDTSVSSASRAQAQANADAAEAHLDEMLAGARKEDVSVKQTAVDQANASLVNLYSNSTTNILQSYDKAFSGLAQYTDSLFNQQNSSNPTLVFSTSNSQLASTVVASRVAVQSELSAWQKETLALALTSSHDQIDSALSESLNHLQIIRTYSDQLLSALSSALPSSTFSQASISAGQISVGTYRDSINSIITTLQNAQQQISLAKLSVQSAADALNQVVAGSTPEQLAVQQATVAAAKANVDSIDAQIRNQIVVAPFSGTVASVHVKVGDIVGANTPAVSLNPESALQVVVYFSEIDIAKIHTGDSAQVTLDAYGSNHIFDAHVVSVDSAPSQIESGTGYKATFQFVKSDPSVVSGMTANITIPLNK